MRPMRGMRTAALMLVCTSACQRPPPEPRPPAELALKFVLRQSCGNPDPLEYDTSCLHSVDFRVFDEERNTPVYSECRILDEVPTTMRALLNGDPIIDFSRLSTNSKVSFEVRGLHGVGLEASERQQLCANAVDNKQWLFWGESDVIDLSKYDQVDGGVSPLIDIVVDCRDCFTDDQDECASGQCFGCLAIDEEITGVCPAEFPLSVCAPAVRCGKPCDNDDDCFEGALDCVDERCVPYAEQETAGLCTPCVPGNGTCGDLACVGEPGDATGFCAPLCPTVSCVDGTKCTRFGNGIVDLGDDTAE
jgi:hypothetical protein